MPDNNKKKIFVIGIDGSSAFSPKAEELLMNAESVLASRRLDELLKEYAIYPLIKDKLKVITPIAETMEFLRATSGPTAIIASGDPLFYGIGSKIMDELIDGPEAEVPEVEIEILPALSSIQIAFSRIGVSWHDAELISLHGSTKRKWTVDDLPLLCQRHQKLAILTGGENSPSKLAQMLPSKSKVHVLERLGYPDERVSKGTPEEVSHMEYKDPNIMIVLTAESNAPVFGLNEGEFQHERALITKDEVRAVALHKLRLPFGPSGGVFWDVGSGSGSVGIEAKRLSPGLSVYAIEKDPSRVKDIEHNAKELCAGEINVLEGEAPEAFKDLADQGAPDRVFIGGGGAGLAGIIRAAWELMDAGIIVASTITIESLSEAMAELKALGATPEVTSLSISRSRDVGGRDYLKAENQIFLIKAEKPVNG